jgi:hypothetical protein
VLSPKLKTPLLLLTDRGLFTFALWHVIASGRRVVLKLYLLTIAGTTTKLSHRGKYHAWRMNAAVCTLTRCGNFWVVLDSSYPLLNYQCPEILRMNFAERQNAPAVRAKALSQWVKKAALNCPKSTGTFQTRLLQCSSDFFDLLLRSFSLLYIYMYIYS